MKRDRKTSPPFTFPGTPEKRFTMRVLRVQIQWKFVAYFSRFAIIPSFAFDLLFIILIQPPWKWLEIIKFSAAPRKINEISVMKFAEKIIIWINNNFEAFSIRKTAIFISLFSRSSWERKRCQKQTEEKKMKWFWGVEVGREGERWWGNN